MTSTLLCNHVTWLDSMILLSRFSYAPVMEARNWNMGIIGVCTQMLDAVYVNRSNNKEEL
jgi:1-acyl-sn-glycerol-3-phosphate acyltransferase